jgi:hypothetical protein
MRGFAVATIALAPRDERAYREDEWRDAIVLVAAGELELEARGGARRRFPRGSILHLTRLPLRALRNPGAEPVRLVAVSRRDR